MLNAYDLDIASDGIRLTDTRAVFGSNKAMPCIEVQTQALRALVSFQGAQLLSFRPTGQSDWLWLSPSESYTPGEAIRGGVPLCAPWFGVNRQQPGLAKHGFLRNREWRLAGADELANQVVRLRFTFNSTEQDLALFPYPFSAELDMYLADHVVMALKLRNDGDQPMPASFAFHSYLAVDELAEVSIDGLRGAEYLDNTRGLAADRQFGELKFDGEIDRVYQGLGGAQQLHTPSLPVYVDGKGCDTVIVWNPGEKQAQGMTDVGDQYRNFVCLERGMAFADSVNIAPGQWHQGLMVLSRDGNAGFQS